MKPGVLKAAREAVGGVADTVGRNKAGNLIFRRSFFYTHGYTADKFSAAVKAKLAAVGIDVEFVDSGEHWRPFRGSASVAEGSHWSAEFSIKPEPEVDVGDLWYADSLSER